MSEKIDPIEPKDIQSFIDGLKTSFDFLGEADIMESKGFQAQIAKAISNLRMKKIARIDKQLKYSEKFTKEELKQYLIAELEELKEALDSQGISIRKRYGMVLEITKLRERISQL